MDLPADYFLGRIRAIPKAGYPTPVLIGTALADIVERGDGAVAVGSSEQAASDREAPFPGLLVLELGRKGVIWSRSFALCPTRIDCYAWTVRPAAITRFGDGFAVVGTAMLSGYAEQRLFVVRLTAEGEIVWAKVYDRVVDTSAIQMTGVGIADVTPPGAGAPRLLVLGSAPNEPLGPSRPTRAIAFTVDGDGELAGCAYSYSGLDEAYPSALRATPGQGVFILGQSAGGAGQAKRSGWLLQIAPDGGPRWERFYGDASWSALADIAEGTESLVIIGRDNTAALVLNVAKDGHRQHAGAVLSCKRSSRQVHLRAILAREVVVLPVGPGQRFDHERLDVEYRSSVFVLAGSESALPWVAQIDEKGTFLWQKAYGRYQAELARVAWPRSDIAAVGATAGSSITETGLAAWSGGEVRRGRELCGGEGTVTLTPVSLAATDGPGRFEEVKIEMRAWQWEERAAPLLEIDCPSSDCGDGAPGSF